MNSRSLSAKNTLLQKRVGNSQAKVLRALQVSKKRVSCGGCSSEKAGTKPSPHPDHSSQALRLKKVRGQILGIEKMIESRRYCVDILVQFRAVSAALVAVEAKVLESHLEGCVAEVIQSKNEVESKKKISELVSLFSKRMK